MAASLSRKSFRRRSQRPSSGHFIFSQVPCSAGRHVTIPIAETAQRLRGLVQHVLSFIAPSPIIRGLIASRLWGIKRYTLARQDTPRWIHFEGESLTSSVLHQ